MKSVNIFLISTFLICGCQKESGQSTSASETAKIYDELDMSHLDGPPLENPQESLLKEATSGRDTLLESEESLLH